MEGRVPKTVKEKEKRMIVQLGNGINLNIPKSHMDWVASLPKAEYRERKNELLSKLRKFEWFVKQCYPFYDIMIDWLWYPPIKIVLKKK